MKTVLKILSFISAISFVLTRMPVFLLTSIQGMLILNSIFIFSITAFFLCLALIFIDKYL